MTILQFFIYISEAICETVGSLICGHAGRGRTVDPKYLDRELFVKFNGPPLHLARPLIERVVDKRIAKKKSPLDTVFVSKNPNRLIQAGVGSSIARYRQRQSEKMAKR